MRGRHHPRLCHSCRAPLARQEDVCWRCGTAWTAHADPPATPRALAWPAAADATRLDAERWTNEGGGLAPAVAAGLAQRPRGD